MYLKGACLAAAISVSLINSAAKAEDPILPNGITGFHPYVSLGSRCDGIGSRLAGIPIPLGASPPTCPATGESADEEANQQPLLLVFDADSGRITGTRPY